MVQILPLIGAAALLAQTAFGAAVPVRRTSHGEETNNHEVANNNANEYNANRYESQQSNQYQNQYQESNRYASQNNAHQVENNRYENQYENQYQQNNQHEATTSIEHLAAPTLEHQVAPTLEHVVETTTEHLAPQETRVLPQEQPPVHEIPAYGSGSSSWNAGYNDCVSQCMAQYGQAPSALTLDHQAVPEATGTGAIHTIMVAPDGAGLRYVPFAVNATVGDTIRYVWTTPGNHTATLSTSLAICNRSAEAESRSFVSGIRSAAAGVQTFDVVVQTEEPQFFYCSVAQHCEKGMFGIINPSQDVGNANTVGSMMASMMQNNPQLQAANEYIRQNVTDRAIQNWGSDISVEGMSETEITEVINNVIFTRAMYGANPGMLEFNHGAATPDDSPIMVPQGLNVLLSNTAQSAPATTLIGSAIPTPTGTGTIVAPLANGAFSVKGGASFWAAAFVGALGWLLI